MKRFLIPFFVLITLITLALPVQTAQAIGTTVGGTVYHGTRPMAGVTITTTYEVSSNPGSRTTVTDAAGAYSFTYVLEDRIKISAPDIPGYSSPSPKSYTNPTGTANHFTYTGSRVFSGRILVSGSVNPFEGVRVTLTPPVGYDAPPVLYTDANGGFSFATLEPVVYTATFYYKMYGREYLFEPQGVTVNLTAGDLTNFEGIGSEPTWITGQIRKPDNGGTINGLSVNLKSGLNTTLVSAATGSYSTNYLMRGLDYTLTLATPPAHITVLPPASLTYSQLGDPVNGANFYAVGTPYINGRVTMASKPVGDLTVVLQNADGMVVCSTVTNAQGYYWLDGSGSSGVGPGTYHVIPAYDNLMYAGASKTVMVADKSLTGVNLTVSAAKVPVRGRILTKSGVPVLPSGPANVPVAGATVTIRKYEGGSMKYLGVAATVLTDAAGYYNASLSAGFAYTFTPTKTGYLFLSKESGEPTLDLDNLLLDDVLPSGYTFDPDFEAYKVFTVSGKVVSSYNGQGVADVTILSRTEYNGLFYERSASTNASGVFVLRNVPDLGDTKLYAQPKYATTFNPAEMDLDTVSSNMTGLVFSSQHQLYTLTVTLKTNTGQLLGGSGVELLNTTPACSGWGGPWAETNSLGVVKFYNLRQGCDYRIEPTDLYGFTIPDAQKNVTSAQLTANLSRTLIATPQPRTFDFRFLNLGPSTVTLNYRVMGSSTWKTTTFVGADPDIEHKILNLARSYDYEFKPVASNYRFEPAVANFYAGGDPLTEYPFSAIALLTVKGAAKVEGVAVSNVTIVPEPGTGPNTAKTNSYGLYTIKVDKYSGSGPANDLYLDAFHPYFSFARIAVKDNLDLATNANFTDASVVVTGRVVNRSTGAGEPGVEIYAGAGATRVSTFTTAQGYFSLTVPDESVSSLRSFAIYAKKTGFSFSPASRPVSTASGRANKNFVAVPLP